MGRAVAVGVMVCLMMCLMGGLAGAQGGAGVPRFDGAAAEAAAKSVKPAEDALRRLCEEQNPGLEKQFKLVRVEKKADGKDFFRVTGTAGHIRVEGTSNNTVLYGVNWYLKYVAHLQISTNGSNLKFKGALPGVEKAIEIESPYAWRYALNENTDGYTAPYWEWPRWEHEIDVMAASGINALIVERGMDLVLYRTFVEQEYGDEEIRRWITQPAHQNWQLMGNMCCFDGPISMELLEKRARSAQQLIKRMKELGIVPVLQGYYGVVPADFAMKHKGAHVIEQGEWNGFTRPGWLDPRDENFAKVAQSFYRNERELFGDTKVYDMEIFQEGGAAGDVPVAEGARAVQAALTKAHPDGLWMLLAWQTNPTLELLKGVDRSKLFIVDIEQGRVVHDDREGDFLGAPWLFGGLWEFGGRTTLGANLYEYSQRLPKLGMKPGSTMIGTALYTEGMDTNPFAYDLFTEMAWRREPVEPGPAGMDTWAAEYATRRYGGEDAHAVKAWQTVLHTAYGARADGVKNHGERDSAVESLFNAQPSLDAKRGFAYAPDELRYRVEDFRPALTELLKVVPALRESAGYKYDIVDIGRQVLANESRVMLPQIKAAYEAKDEAEFARLTKRWLTLMELQDELLATNRFFLLGTWLQPVDGWAGSPEEKKRLEYDARSILTTWGDRKASDVGELHEYGNKDWAGLTKDYYLPRWKMYFDSLDVALKNQAEPKKIDWYAFGDKWNTDDANGAGKFSALEKGDGYGVGVEIGLAVQAGAASPQGTDR